MGDDAEAIGGEAWGAEAAAQAWTPQGPDVVIGQSHADSTARVSISGPTAHPHIKDGLSYIGVSLHITNHSGRALTADELFLVFSAYAESGEAEQNASVALPVGALAEGQSDAYPAFLQVDPGRWSVYAAVMPKGGGGLPIADITAIPVTVAGTAVDRPAHLDATVEISVRITDVVQQMGAAYRVHYVVENRGSQIPPGLVVRGHLWSAGGEYFAEQIYTLTQPLPHGESHDHYLTLEGLPSEQGMWAQIRVAADTPSEAQATVRVAMDAHGRVHSFTTADAPPVPYA